MKWSRKLIAQARELHMMGKSYREIALVFDVTPQAIRELCRREGWGRPRMGTLFTVPVTIPLRRVDECIDAACYLRRDGISHIIASISEGYPGIRGSGYVLFRSQTRSLEEVPEPPCDMWVYEWPRG